MSPSPGPTSEAVEPCFLGVEESLSGKRWIARSADGRHAMALSQRLGVPEIIGRALSARGIGLEDADDFLHPTLKRLLPDPSVLKDMDAAAERLAGAVTGVFWLIGELGWVNFRPL
jgi:single-stranded-DNA-specific exonuclease